MHSKIQYDFFSFSEALFYGSIASYVAGILLLMSFCSPYWLQSWEDTQSPFKNMGLWEFCFYKFRHPDYQFDHLFHGCHALYGHEYRLIREKLLPGWLMVVQLFVTLALISSFLGQAVIVCLLLRAPLEWILRFEWHFCGIALVCKGVTGKFVRLRTSRHPSKIVASFQLYYFSCPSASLGENAGAEIGFYIPIIITSVGVTLLQSFPVWAT